MNADKNFSAIVINRNCVALRLSKEAKPMPSRHRFLEPIYNVKDGGKSPVFRLEPERHVFIPGECFLTLYIAHQKNADGKFGGAYRDRTDDLMLAKQPLSQLS